MIRLDLDLGVLGECGWSCGWPLEGRRRPGRRRSVPGGGDDIVESHLLLLLYLGYSKAPFLIRWKKKKKKKKEKEMMIQPPFKCISLPRRICFENSNPAGIHHSGTLAVSLEEFSIR